MDNVMLDNAAVDLETQIARYQELTTQKSAIEERISRAESERPSVKDKIFQRVLREYEKELEILDGDLTPLEKEINAARSSLQNKVTDIEIQTADLQDRLDEIAFRHRVGEFNDSQKAEKQDPIEIEYDELTQQGIEYVQQLDKLETIQFDMAETTEESAPTDENENAEEELALSVENPVDDSNMNEPVATEPTPADAVAPARGPLLDEKCDAPRQEEEQLDLEPANEEEALVNPSDWVEEFADEDILRAPAAAADAVAPEQEGNSEDKANKNGPGEVLGFSELDMNNPDEKSNPLSELADPSDETDQAEDTADALADENIEEQASATVQDSSLGFPILSITKGAGSGKKLPLLPMTMTIGRELDNNIELKDQDVARYHARITYHAGEYVIHDLEGSPGTFVNNEKISKYTLSPGDTIRTGETELKFDME